MMRCVIFLAVTVAFWCLVDCNNQREFLLSKNAGQRNAGLNHRSRRAVLTQPEISEVINTHNQLRGQEGASNMEVMVYSSYLAGLADSWTQQCTFTHSSQDLPASRPVSYSQIGQSIYITTDAMSITLATQSWYNEKINYTYDTGNCISVYPGCGHYTQVVWATSHDIGCAYNSCPVNNTIYNYLVCNYGPVGNVMGQKPFLKGSACTQCQSGSYWCSQRLCNGSCSASDASCVCSATCTGSTVDTSTCTCSGADNQGPTFPLLQISLSLVIIQFFSTIINH